MDKNTSLIILKATAFSFISFEIMQCRLFDYAMRIGMAMKGLRRNDAAMKNRSWYHK